MKPVQFTQHLFKGRSFDARHIVKRHVPLSGWINRYNKKWLIGDLIAGITIGIMLVPQALAYAQLASVPVQYGLYSSFLGVAIYCIFGTSKDISVGPSAVLALYIGTALDPLIAKGYDPIQCVVTMSFLIGCFALGLGIFRLGIILDLISIPVIKGFTAGAAVTIFFSQITSLLGISGAKVQGPIIDVIKAIIAVLPRTRWQDALVGFSGIALMVILKWMSAKLSNAHPAIKMLGITRSAICVILFTLLSFAVTKTQGEGVITVVGKIPTGFPIPAAPRLDGDFISQLAGPSIIGLVVAIIEHIAAARTYGRLNNYKTDSSQEFIALGVCNIFNSFFSTFPVTGALSRSAVISQSGVRTPASGIFTSVVVMLCLNFLPPVMYFVPKPILAAIIMVSIVPLICGFSVYKQLWDIQKTDMIACLLAFLVTIFTNIETGIEVAVGFSLLISLHRIARPKWQMLGEAVEESGIYADRWSNDWATYPSPPGIVIFRFSESITFLNGEYFKDKVLNAAYIATEPAEKLPDSWAERIWSDDRDSRIRRIRNAFIQQLPPNAINRPSETSTPDVNFESDRLSSTDDLSVAMDTEKKDSIATLKAVILDFSGVNHVDFAGLQCLLDLKSQLTNYAGNRGFELHFVGLKSNVLRRIEPSGITRHPDDGPEEQHRYMHLSIRDSVQCIMEDWHHKGNQSMGQLHSQYDLKEKFDEVDIHTHQP
ncbi:Sulfate permease 2 [Basidiobolus ranarum]|uniref:Sulfate permease 2 n=1 Tax=Basidiobolus ranarum TaxID=34480 RepID=A0ABR2X285_9FUNG